MAEATYLLQPMRFLVLHDREDDRHQELLFHVSAGDYFGTLASILSLLKGQENQSTDILDHLRQDLIYLQHSHRIVPKDDSGFSS